MKKRAIPILTAAIVVLLAGPGAQAQDENAPPFITNIDFTIFRNVGDSPFGPFIGPFAFEAGSDVADELDILLATVTIVDPDWVEGEEDIYWRQQAFWIPFTDNNRVTYLTPEPPPIPEANEDFLPEDGFSPPEGVLSVDITFQFTIPRWLGKNQARLRGLINYDVRWVFEFAVSNEQDPDCIGSTSSTTILVDGQIVEVGACAGIVTFAGVFIHAVENPVLAPPNAHPMADAGADQIVESGSTVILDASRTFDSFNVGFDVTSPNVFEKDVLTYTWEWISGPQRVDPIYRDPEFHPELAEVTLNTIGIYEYRLTVDDNVNALPTTDTVRIEVVSLIPKNRAPVAVIVGPTDSVIVGGVILLDGTSSSDPDGDVLSFRWRQIDELGGNLAESDVLDLFQPLGGVESPISTWQATQAGTFYFRLLVDDGLLIDSKTISLTVVEPGSVVAVTGGDGTGKGFEGGSSAAGDPSDEAVTAPLSVPACGGGLLPLAMLPFALWMGRGRIR